MSSRPGGHRHCLGHGHGRCLGHCDRLGHCHRIQLRFVRVRRWRMETTTTDCKTNLIAFDVLERGDFFEVRQTNLGADCETLSGNRAEACHAAVDFFGPVPADAESVPGLPDGYEGDASLEP